MARPPSTARSPNGDSVSRSAHDVAPPRPVLGPGVTPGAGRGLDRGEAGLPGPGQQVPARVRLAAERPGHVPVQRLPFGQPGVVGEPEETAVVAVARGDQAAGPAHPPHLGQRRDRIGQVLQYLVRVHHVERSVGEAQVVDVPDLEPDVGLPPPVRLLPGQRQHVAGRVDAGHLAVRHPGGQVDGDRARAAADVEHTRVGRQSRQQVPGRVLRGPPAVRPQHAVVMTVQVGIGGR